MRGRVSRLAGCRHRRPGVSARRRRRSARPARLGASRAARRSGCAWSKAPTGTTRPSSPRSAVIPIPVFADKAETDANYERCTAFLIENWRDAAPGDRHAQRPLGRACAGARRSRSALPPRAVEFQVLYGMGDADRPRARRAGRARARLRAVRRTAARHGLSRPPPAGEHLQRFVRARRLARQADADSAARGPGPPARATAQCRSVRRQIARSAFATSRRPTSRVPENQRCDAAPRSAAVREPRSARTSRSSSAAGANASPRIGERPDPSRHGAVASRVHYATPEQARRAIDGRARPRFPAGATRRSPTRAELLRARRATSSSAAASRSPPGRSTKSASPGARPTPMSPRRSTSAATTPTRWSGWPRRAARNVPGEWNDYFYERARRRR